METGAQVATIPRGAGEVFIAFLRLGLTAFGGPIAHIAYFRDTFVVRRRWLDEIEFAEIVSLCQFLPGPASSQLGFAIGWKRAGALGALAAWTAFTLPSALLMLGLAMSAAAAHTELADGLIHGLKLVAVAVVAHAVFGMARSLTPDLPRAAIALVAAGIVMFTNAFVGQVEAIAAGVALGLWLCRRDAKVVEVRRPLLHVSKPAGVTALLLFVVLLFGIPILNAGAGDRALAHFDAFYRSGALVFGGGHVVLPLLREAVVVPGLIDQDTFLAGYGAAQALPGPLFALAAYLGAALNEPPNGVLGAMLALGAIFLPGLLALVGLLPFWNGLRGLPSAQASIAGANAAVVGILAVALYNPIWTSAVHDVGDVAAAVFGFLMLIVLRSPPIVVVGLGVAYGLAMTIS